ncbi:nitrite reductase [uncultured Massilia sp.]|uniref:XAC2610-related protein n=1 Tax=uncultured Massilia sp. TaxID=169973 RepID=UPI0025FD3809|nr:nitrite reductase [uncultured Massilia sp.]
MPAIRSVRSVLAALLTCLLLTCLLLPLLSAPAWAAQDGEGDDPVEFPAWTRTYTGRIGDKAVEATLIRIDDRLSGSYCYAPCSIDPGKRLALEGDIKDDKAELTERDMQKSSAHAAHTGTWELDWTDGAPSGTWRAPDGTRSLPLRLRETQPFPFDVRIVASDLPDRDDSCERAPHVSAVRLYRDGKLFQELPTDSQNTCGVFVPNVVDADFDGAPDLTLALDLPNSPDVPHQSWLFDRAGGRFRDAPDSLQEVTAPEFDAPHAAVVSQWRNGCCEHGVTTYRWQAGNLMQSAMATSAVVPVLVGGARRYCYVMPAYRDGRIDYPERVEQIGARLVLTLGDFKDCTSEDTLTPMPRIDVWKRAPDGALKLVRSEAVRWKQVATAAGKRYCPEVPFFERDRIRRIVLSEHPDELCTETRP